MSHKRTMHQILGTLLVSLLLAGCSGKSVQPTLTPIPPTATPIPPTNTPISSPTLPPAPTAIPASNDLMTVGNFEFQISEVRIANTIGNIPGGPVSNYKGTLVMAADGFVPKDAKPGNVLLMVFLTLKTGENQSLLDSDLKIIEGDSTKSAVVILNQTQDNRVIWVYDVKPSSKSFLLMFPDDVAIDITPLLP